MQSPLKHKEKLLIGNYVVGFFDLLGHEEAMRRTPCVFHAGMESMDSFDQEFLPIVRGLIELAEGFEKVLTTLSSNQPQLTELIRHNPRFSPPPIRPVPFSDGIVMYCPFNNELSGFPTHSVSTIIAAAGIQQLYCLAKGIPWRGGVELCWGIEIFENHLTGKAVQEAVSLEKAARFPRVMIGKNLVRFLRDTAADRSSNQRAVTDKNLNSNIAGHVLGQLSIGGDGTASIDYLSDEFLSGYPFASLAPLTSKAKEFASAQILHWKEEGNEKRVARYEELLEYLESRT